MYMFKSNALQSQKSRLTKQSENRHHQVSNTLIHEIFKDTNSALNECLVNSFR